MLCEEKQTHTDSLDCALVENIYILCICTVCVYVCVCVCVVVVVESQK